MISLKTFLPLLEKPLLTDSVALYERQRVLVRRGVLRASAGRGPGSGVRLTAHNLAVLLISVLASDTLVDTGDITRLFVNLVHTAGKCPMTNAAKLVDALASALASKDILASVGDLVVRREDKRATFFNEKNDVGQRFLDRRYRSLPIGLVTDVKLRKGVLVEISTAFLKLSADG